MGKKYLVHDTMEVYLKDLATQKERFLGLTTQANITRSIDSEKIKAGIGNKVVATLLTDNGYEFTVATGIHLQDVYEIQTGKDFTPSSDIEIYDIAESDGVVTATPKTVTGEELELTADNLPHAYEVQLKTVAKDPDTQKTVADIIYQFYKATPDGNLNDVYQAGTNQTQEIKFIAQVPVDGNSYGRMLVIPKEQQAEPQP